MTCNFKHPVSRVIVMPCFILCMYVKWEWKHLNTGSMALLRIKSTFLQTEEFVCSRLAQSPYTHLQTEGRLLYMDLWEGFSVLGKGSYRDGFLF